MWRLGTEIPKRKKTFRLLFYRFPPEANKTGRNIYRLGHNWTARHTYICINLIHLSRFQTISILLSINYIIFAININKNTATRKSKRQIGDTNSRWPTSVNVLNRLGYCLNEIDILMTSYVAIYIVYLCQLAKEIETLLLGRRLRNIYDFQKFYSVLEVGVSKFELCSLTQI